MNIGIRADFVYYKYINHNKENVSRYDYVYQARNYEHYNRTYAFLMIWLILKTLI